MYDLAMNTDDLSAADRAEALFREGYSCSQSVLMAFAPRLGMPERQAALVASAFGGGMARHGWTCGAVTGAMMAVGLGAGHATAEDTATKEELYFRVQALVARFEEQHGASACRQLVGANMLDPADRQAASDRGVFTTLCPQLVRTAATLVAEALSDPRPSVAPAKAGAHEVRRS
jgi:C_GCAxxG_C_C family probable redox protein